MSHEAARDSMLMRQRRDGYVLPPLVVVNTSNRVQQRELMDFIAKVFGWKEPTRRKCLQPRDMHLRILIPPMEPPLSYAEAVKLIAEAVWRQLPYAQKGAPAKVFSLLQRNILTEPSIEVMLRGTQGRLNADRLAGALKTALGHDGTKVARSADGHALVISYDPRRFATYEKASYVVAECVDAERVQALQDGMVSS